MIYRVVALAVLSLLLAACGGGGGPHDDALSAQLDLHEELVGILEGVTDEASAKAAVPEVKALGLRMKKVIDQMSNMPELSMDEAKAVTEKYAKRMAETQQKTVEHMMKLGQYPELAKAITSAMTGGE